tara:strand:+ start:602 stop:2032 length:1431 start_codon:yes stop_codon:yes gene_type:complete
MKHFLFILSFIYCISSDAQSNNYKIEGEIIGLKDTSILLGCYFRDSGQAIDTAYSKNGKFIFTGDKKLKKGMYFIMLPNYNLQLVINEKEIKFKTSLKNPVKDMIFSKSLENQPFYNYLSFINEQQKIVAPLREKLKSSNNNQNQEIKKKLENIDKEIIKFRDDFINENKEKFFSDILKATLEPIIPDPNFDVKKNEKKFKEYQLNYYINHYWDNVNLLDSGIIRTSFFFNRLNTYFDKVVYQIPDSLIKYSNLLIKRSSNNKEVFRYIVGAVTDKYRVSKIMGFDAVFVEMVEKYHMTGLYAWKDSTNLLKMIERAGQISPNLIGKVAPEFTDNNGTPFMKDLNDNIHTIQSIKANYTLLVFYGPSCGHCKKEIPKIKNTIDSLINLNYDIKTLAVATEFDVDEWKKFIKEQKIESWINVSDIRFDNDNNPVASSDWRSKYDIYSTPVVYLLDKEKKILAKRITHQQFADVITRE